MGLPSLSYDFLPNISSSVIAPRPVTGHIVSPTAAYPFHLDTQRQHLHSLAHLLHFRSEGNKLAHSLPSDTRVDWLEARARPCLGRLTGLRWPGIRLYLRTSAGVGPFRLSPHAGIWTCICAKRTVLRTQFCQTKRALYSSDIAVRGLHSTNLSFTCADITRVEDCAATADAGACYRRSAQLHRDLTRHGYI